MRVMRRYTIVFALLSAAAAALYALGTADLLPLNATGQAAVTFLMPGFWLRGLASGTELGFQDWRDVALTVFGAAGCLTLAFIVLDQAWTRWRRRSGAPVA